MDQLIADSVSTHTRSHGTPREKELPIIKKKGKARIPRTLIDPHWLASHPESDTPLRIQEIGQEWPEEHDGDSGEEDDLYADPGEYDAVDPWDEADKLWQFEGYSPEGDM